MELSNQIMTIYTRIWYRIQEEWRLKGESKMLDLDNAFMEILEKYFSEEELGEEIGEADFERLTSKQKEGLFQDLSDYEILYF